MAKVQLFSLLLFFISSSPSFSATIHVPGDQSSIQAGIAAAQKGDSIIVAPGTYFENINFLGKTITVKGDQGAEMTFIDGRRIDTTVRFENREGPDTILEGFTIENGKADQGGGMCIRFASHPTIRDCVFKDNSASDQGGGLYVLLGDPNILNCTFKGNWADEEGGGIFATSSYLVVENSAFIDNWGGDYGGGMGCRECAHTVLGCRFIDNSAWRGAGMYNNLTAPIIRNCSFEDNEAVHYGGGLCNQNNSHAIVANCTFQGNYGGTYSGGMFNYIDSHANVTNCIFLYNTSNKYGGGLGNKFSDPKVTNCVFINNWTQSYGGGLGNEDSNPEIINCTFYGNISGQAGGAIGSDALSGNVKIKNCIAWNNSLLQIGGVNTQVSFSNVEGGFVGDGNINADPRFVDPENGDFHLLFTSPCLDAGEATANLPQHDFEGDPRIHLSEVDMGADEFHRHLYCTGTFETNEIVMANLVDLPGTAPIGLIIGSGLLENPKLYSWGYFYLESPWWAVPLSSIPANGILQIEDMIPETPAGPYEIPLQAIMGSQFSNLYLIEVDY